MQSAVITVITNLFIRKNYFNDGNVAEKQFSSVDRTKIIELSRMTLREGKPAVRFGAAVYPYGFIYSWSKNSLMLLAVRNSLELHVAKWVYVRTNQRRKTVHTAGR